MSRGTFYVFTGDPMKCYNSYWKTLPQYLNWRSTPYLTGGCYGGGCCGMGVFSEIFKWSMLSNILLSGINSIATAVRGRRTPPQDLMTARTFYPYVNLSGNGRSGVPQWTPYREEPDKELYEAQKQFQGKCSICKVNGKYYALTNDNKSYNADSLSELLDKITETQDNSKTKEEEDKNKS